MLARKQLQAPAAVQERAGGAEDQRCCAQSCSCHYMEAVSRSVSSPQLLKNLGSCLPCAANEFDCCATCRTRPNRPRRIQKRECLPSIRRQSSRGVVKSDGNRARSGMIDSSPCERERERHDLRLMCTEKKQIIEFPARGEHHLAPAAFVAGRHVPALQDAQR